MFSLKSHHALRALQLLAQRDNKSPVQAADISATARLPLQYLELILVELKRAGLTRSVRGRNGGYLLARPADQISFGDVLRVTDSAMILQSCEGAHSAAQDCEICKGLASAHHAAVSMLNSLTLTNTSKLDRKKSRSVQIRKAPAPG